MGMFAYSSAFEPEDIKSLNSMLACVVLLILHLLAIEYSLSSARGGFLFEFSRFSAVCFEFVTMTTVY